MTPKELRDSARALATQPKVTDEEIEAEKQRQAMWDLMKQYSWPFPPQDDD